ncbi:manganese efflux pump MntP [Neobacillus thermocopriae]|uniref:Putative manganese efflux pump MntP n=1 Tax=Neobacillus thermocopriae TaxID=1215031 RepID=A0A6B3TNQ1_9BACI|nr:manganese efflux pump MntP family protein [Neobacillus thermocopriae]MED3623856.1 manganese efflux pump MntP family protein [Neobacillus thermocopriae]MED3713312.1 manganese efflux pump MntP family protein [Neobacillus thermocopriae]NEX78248.1 manganese efflux pump [Neobacillus thermocopriae]
MAEMIGELVALILMAVALGMDAFSVGLGMGMYQLRLRKIFQIGIMIGIFHVLMPLFGITAGKFLSEKFGTFATFIGGALLIVLGIQMIWSSLKKEEEKIITPIGFGLIFFALSVSLDSFSVGLSLGIFGARTMLVLICFGIMATIQTWAGLLLGRKVRHWIGCYSEALGGGILLAFGFKLITVFW